MTSKRPAALITGATSGIGYEMARIFASRGYDLFLASRNIAKQAEIKSQFEKDFGISVATMPVDLAQSGSARSVYDETLRRKMDIHVLVNNAGFAVGGELADMDARQVGEMIHLNMTTLTELCSLCGRDMKKKKSGHILNVASTAAYQPLPCLAVYAATKSYVLNFSEALAKEMEDYNVVVTCLSPGPTDTNFFARVGVEGLSDKQTGFWAKNKRMASRKVAEIGIRALFAKKLSVVAGNLNSFFAFSCRLSPRKFTATVSKRIIKQAMHD